MNETDNPRSERRRSSRGRRRRSNGGDRAAQAQNPGAPAAQQAPQNPNQNQSQNQGKGQSQRRQNKSARPSGGERQGRGNDRSARSAESTRGDRGGDRSGGKQQRRGDRPETGKANVPARERFNAPRIVSPTLPKPVCPRCGAQIEDLPSALNDKESGAPIHFDCVLARLTESETLADGEKIVYLGGGRFGVVLFENPSDLKHFRVRKLIQWEEKEKRADWRREVSDLYSAT